MEILRRQATIQQEFLHLEPLIEEMRTWAEVREDSWQLKTSLEESARQRLNLKFLPSGLTIVCLNEFPVDPDPKPHDYSDQLTGDAEHDRKLVSHAINHIDGHDYKGHKLWANELPFKSAELEEEPISTSTHTHNDPEIALVLFGQILVNGRIIRAGDFHIVQPFTEHPAQPIDGPAAMLCVLVNGANKDNIGVHEFK